MQLGKSKNVFDLNYRQPNLDQYRAYIYNIIIVILGTSETVSHRFMTFKYYYVN